MPDAETAHQIRGIVSRAVVHATNDNGESQTANVTMFKDIDRSDVEILQPYGFSSRPPSKGAVMVVLAVGGDQGDLVGFMPGAPGMRLGNLEEGEAAIHTADGSRVHVKKDGSIDSISSKRVTGKVEEAEYEVEKDMVRGRLGADGPRYVLRPDYAKLRFGAHWLVVKADGIFSSVPVVVGPDPEPDR